jgi:hypothetical protein
MYLVQQATRLIHTWTKDEQVVSDILSSFINSNGDLVDSCTENPNPALEVVLLYKLDSFIADYLEKKSLTL